MKNHLSFLWWKVSYFLNWSPVWCIQSQSLSDERLQIFSKFQQEILTVNLQYVYMIISCLSLVTFLVDILFVVITEERPNYLNSSHLLALHLACIVYHTVLFVLLRVKCLKKKVLKIIGFLNVISIILLQLFFGFHVAELSSGSSLITLTVRLSIIIFLSSVQVVYFHNSFVLSMFFWILLALLTFGVLTGTRHQTADFDSVVSCCCCCCSCVVVVVIVGTLDEAVL